MITSTILQPEGKKCVECLVLMNLEVNTLHHEEFEKKEFNSQHDLEILVGFLDTKKKLDDESQTWMQQERDFNSNDVL